MISRVFYASHNVTRKTYHRGTTFTAQGNIGLNGSWVVNTLNSNLVGAEVRNELLSQSRSDSFSHVPKLGGTACEDECDVGTNYVRYARLLR